MSAYFKTRYSPYFEAIHTRTPRLSTGLPDPGEDRYRTGIGFEAFFIVVRFWEAYVRARLVQV